MRRHSGFQSWREYLLHLEEKADGLSDAADKASLCSEVAGEWESKYLDKERAIVNFQKAFKANAGDVEALRSALAVVAEEGIEARLEPVDVMIG